MSSFLFGILSPIIQNTASITLLSNVFGQALVSFGDGWYFEVTRKFPAGTNVGISALPSVVEFTTVYTFKGWYTEELGGTLISTARDYTIQSVAANANIIYYAQYSSKPL